jgi:hypothetical protein
MVNESEAIIERGPGLDSFTTDFFQNSKELALMFLKFILWSQSYPDTKTRQTHKNKKKTIVKIFFMYIDGEVIKRILANKIQQYI